MEPRNSSRSSATWPYHEARTRARAYRHCDDGGGDRHWSKVAVEIAKRTGREIGVKAADRYERDSRPARWVRRQGGDRGRAELAV